MSRDWDPAAARERGLRTTLVGLVWLAGLGAGCYAALGIAARFGCAPADASFACRDGGSAVGAALLAAALVLVTVVTVLAWRVPSRVAVVLAAAALIALAGCAAGAHALVGSG